MRDIKEAPFGKYIWIYVDAFYDTVKYKGIIRCDDNYIDVFVYIVVNVGKDKEAEFTINFKNIKGWDYLDEAC